MNLAVEEHVVHHPSAFFAARNVHVSVLSVLELLEFDVVLVERQISSKRAREMIGADNVIIRLRHVSLRRLWRLRNSAGSSRWVERHGSEGGRLLVHLRLEKQ